MEKHTPQKNKQHNKCKNEHITKGTIHFFVELDFLIHLILVEFDFLIHLIFDGFA